MGNRLIIFVISVIALMVILPILISCTPAATPPVTTTTTTVSKPTEIVINCIQDLTGPSSTTNLPVVAGTIDGAKISNTKGGIDGVPLRVEYHDTRGEVANAVASYAKIRESKPLIVSIQQGPLVDALSKRIAEDKLPCIAAAVSQSAVWPPGWAFCIVGSYADLTGAFIDWLSADWSKSGQTRKCKIAFLNPDMGSGRSCAVPEVLDYIKAKGNIDLVANEFFDYKALDISSDIIRVMQKEPDWIYGYYYGGYGGAALYKSLNATGFKDKVKVGSSGWAMQVTMAQMVGNDLVEGVVGPFGYPPWLPSGQKQVSAGMEMMNKVFEEGKYPANYRGSAYEAGFTVTALIVYALETAVKKAGWDKVSGTTVYDALASTRSTDLYGICSWGVADGSRTNNTYQMFRFQNGTPMPFTDWTVNPDLRPAEFRTAEYKWKAAGWPTGWFNK